MLRRGNCWDNAPQEYFFGHMKDEFENLDSILTFRIFLLKLMTTWITSTTNAISGISQSYPLINMQLLLKRECILWFI